MILDLTTTDGATPWSRLEDVCAAGPIVWCTSLDGWLVSSYEGVRKVLSDKAAFSNEGTPVSQSFAPEAMLVNDGPLHNVIRSVWAKPTAMTAAANMADQMQQMFDILLPPMIAEIRDGKTIDLVKVFEDFTSEVITMLMDIPRDRRDEFQRWNRLISDSALLALEKDDPGHSGQIAKQEVYAFLFAEMVNRQHRLARGEKPEDLISLMAAAQGQGGITESVVLDNLVNLFLGALDTTVKWLGNIVVTLVRHSDVQSQIRLDRSLLPQALEEVMRLETVIQLSQRIVRADGAEIHGQALKSGDNVYVLPGAANRDCMAFDEPHRFDIHRKRKMHMGFGFGIHQCLGMNIARQEAQVAIGRLLDLLPELEVVECRYGPTLSLWGPQALVVRGKPHSNAVQ